MAASTARALGNMARANPRQYSTHVDQAFTHRKEPAMPSFDHFVQTGRTLVSFMTHHIQMVLGTAHLPYMLPSVLAATAPRLRPVLVATETRTDFVQNAIAVINEERGWSNPNSENQSESGYTSSASGKLAIYEWNYGRRGLSEEGNAQFFALSAALPLSQAQATQCSLAIGDWIDHRFHNTQSNARLALATLPATYYGLDGSRVTMTPPAPHYEFVSVSDVLGEPQHTSQLKMIVLAAVATGIAAAATATATALSFFKKLW